MTLYRGHSATIPEAQTPYVADGRPTVPATSIWPWLELPSGSSHPVDLPSWPTITIVTPNYNYGHLIEMTMRSVLMQNYPNLEYIVIDDGSTDDSMRVIRKYLSRLAYFEHHSNQGQYPTINKGFQKATGDIFAWLNSDDLHLPWTLHTVAAIFSQYPQIDWIAGRFSSMQDGIVHKILTPRVFPSSMIRAGAFSDWDGRFAFIQQESCFWRRRLWEQAGGLRTDLEYAADFELWTRFAKHAELYAVSTLLGGFTFRRNQNRSRANRDRYTSDVQATIYALRRRAPSPEARLARRLTRYQTIGQRLSRALANILCSVDDLQGPLLDWSFDESRYLLKRHAFFSL